MTARTKSSSLVLSAETKEELQSYRALKIIAAAVCADVPLRVEVGASSPSSSSSSSPCPPPPSGSTLSLSLCTGDDKPSLNVGTTNAAMSLVARVSGGAVKDGLLGGGDLNAANVDGWMQFLWSSVDMPLQAAAAAAAGSGGGGSPDWDSAMDCIDGHLASRKYMVSDDGVSLVDIGLAVSLYQAIQLKLHRPEEDGEKNANLRKWYDAVTKQAWFQKALVAWKDSASTSPPPAGAGAAATAAAGGGGAGAGVMMNGPSPPVVSKLYKRHRVRIKEVLADQDQYKDDDKVTVTVAGWARTVRKQGAKLLFIEINDGSTGTSLQCVLHEPECEGFEQCKHSGGTGSSFQFAGKIISSKGKGQDVEMAVSAAVLLGPVLAGNIEGTEVGGMYYPLSKKNHTLEHLRDIAHLRPRGAIHAAVMRIRHCMAFATHNFFHQHGFLYVHTPIVTGADCEGAGEQFAVSTMLGNDHNQTGIQLPLHTEEPKKPASAEQQEGGGASAGEGEAKEGGEGEKKLSKNEMKRLAKKKKKQQEADSKIKVDPNKPLPPEETRVVGAVDYTKDFFGQRVNLTVSGQLNVETHACALSDVYTFGPTFRAEYSFTARHLSEFWMIEPEIAFADLTDDINLAEDYLKYCVQYALENCEDDLIFFENNPFGEEGLRDRLRNVLDSPFKRLTYTEAIEILQKAVEVDGVEFEEKPVWGIDLPSEHERYICEKVFKKPVVLTDYPKEIKAFYMKMNDDEKTVAAADILVPKIGEIIGGSQREHRVDVLKRRCLEMHLDPRAVWWYLDLRRYGTVPHAGFGLGFERLILFITGLSNIRDVIPFPRWAGNAKF